LEYSGTKRYVYVVNSEQITQRTEVTLGERVGDEVLIESGLTIGDRVVVQGLVNMRDGLKINEVSLTPKATAATPPVQSPLTETK
ncbi:MAG: efflux transporter periplasmic adaptor subunit, partial [Shewanella sp.]